MAKFSVGEIAIYVGDGVIVRGRDLGEKTCFSYGDEIEILGIDVGRYFVGFHKGKKIYAREESLRKRRPPEQKADDDFCEWFKKTIVKEAPGMDVVYRAIAGTSRPSSYYTDTTKDTE